MKDYEEMDLEFDDDEYEESATPCGCTMFDCLECGSYPVCSQF